MYDEYTVKTPTTDIIEYYTKDSITSTRYNKYKISTT